MANTPSADDARRLNLSDSQSTSHPREGDAAAPAPDVPASSPGPKLPGGPVPPPGPEGAAGAATAQVPAWWGQAGAPAWSSETGTSTDGTTLGDPGAGGRIMVHIQGSFMTGLITPSLSVDGHHMNSRYGANEVWVAPGKHVVRLHSQWIKTYGRASLAVRVGADETVDVYYAAPLNTWVDEGRIGLVKQKRKGWGEVFAILAFTALVVTFITAVSW